MQQTFKPGRTAVLFIMLIFSLHTLHAQNTKSGLEKVVTTTTKYGLFPIKDIMDSRLEASNNIGVDYIRMSVTLNTWDGVDNSGVDYWLDRKKKIVLNINNDTTPYFPTNLTLYKSKLNSILDVYGKSLEMVAIENEELNNDTLHNLYHIGSIQNYINELTAAVTICNQRKIRVINGGLATQVAVSLKHYYDINGKKDSAQWLVQQMGGITSDSTVWKRCDSLLNAYKTLALSYVNLHWYEPKKGMDRITGVLPTLCNYITFCTGKKVVTNESGTRSDSSFMTQLMQQWSLVKPDYCIIYDGNADNNNNAMGLTTTTGNLMPTGMAYRDYIGGGKACKQSIAISPSGIIDSCAGNTITLTATNGFGNYLWNNGQTTQSITVNSTGNYWVKSNHNSCMAYSDAGSGIMLNEGPSKPTVTTNPSPAVDICPGKSIQLLSSVAKSYLWSTGETTKNIKVTNAGNYTVNIYDINKCKATSNVVTVSYQPCSAPKNLKVTGISINKATLKWSPAACAKGYQVQYRIKGVTAWTTQKVSSGVASSLNLMGLSAAIYQWRMLTYCNYSPDTIKSVYVYGPEFTIGANGNILNAIAENLNGFDVKLYPVPAKTFTSVYINPVSPDLKITLMDVYGKILWQKEKITEAVTNVPVSSLSSGIYLVVVKDKEKSKSLTFMKE